MKLLERIILPIALRRYRFASAELRDELRLPAELWSLLDEMRGSGMNIREVAEFLRVDEAVATELLAELIEHGAVVEEVEDISYIEWKERMKGGLTLYESKSLAVSDQGGEREELVCFEVE
ncbi:hypothetical protein ACFPK9_10770 [Rubritalea spongiae]|uniref:MarR family transcriptional regulator n=1 Tax=Rubritalea spongiae TaxID=430797 RepID=A0ABW5DY54_9BACT